MLGVKGTAMDRPSGAMAADGLELQFIAQGGLVILEEDQLC